jgi:hypothetical protein
LGNQGFHYSALEAIAEWLERQESGREEGQGGQADLIVIIYVIVSIT